LSYGEKPVYSTRKGVEPVDLIHVEFKDLRPRVVGDYRVEFMCHYSNARTREMLRMLPYDELRNIHENGPFPLEIRCYNCNTMYRFSEEDIREIYNKAKGN
jgi:molecular chaperone Hsp33